MARKVTIKQTPGPQAVTNTSSIPQPPATPEAGAPPTPASPPPFIIDRMARYDAPIAPEIVHRGHRPPCPECGAFPVVCISKRADSRSYRCRACGLTFTGEGS